MTFRLTPAMSAALRQGLSPIAPLVEVELPGYTVRHLVGSGEIAWGEKVFVGLDQRFGALVAAGNLQDGVADEAPEWLLTFAPPSDVTAATLASSTAQGGRVSGWLAVVDRATGQLLPEPLQVFAGELDYARLRVGAGSRVIEWRCVSALEVFHDQEIGARLSDSWHQMVWPGETGLANMSGIEKTSYWGVEKPPSNVASVPSGTLRAAFLDRIQAQL
ncbi:hypothetical protein GGQ80_002092 [Sphingomonas jinjuensis]|uniref:Uncharacterized protein n=1 Tax=Sphingomonas jinjuensis TaxID=535907 RepID=A0A840FC10_9SPHN|nr:hypothetical protein [Sphingomonas jinjuensis]MBB4154182.1 hypothetical protein [Sphingomonas jinjuensis]